MLLFRSEFLIVHPAVWTSKLCHLHNIWLWYSNLTELSYCLYTLWAVYSSDGRVSTFVLAASWLSNEDTLAYAFDTVNIVVLLYTLFLKDSNKFICLSDNILFFNLVSAIRPSSGHFSIKFKTRYMYCTTLNLMCFSSSRHRLLNSPTTRRTTQLWRALVGQAGGQKTPASYVKLRFK